MENGHSYAEVLERRKSSAPCGRGQGFGGTHPTGRACGRLLCITSVLVAVSVELRVCVVAGPRNLRFVRAAPHLPGMPRAKIDMELQVRNLNLRATEALHKARKSQIMLAMKNHPHLVIDPLYEKLQSLGLSAEQLKAPAESAKSLQALAIDSRKKARTDDANAKKQQLEEEITNAGGLADAIDPLPDKADTLDQLSLLTIRDKLLPALGESSLSAANLRSMKDRDHASKAGLLRYLEFATGLPPDFSLSGQLKCCIKLGKFCRAMATPRGRRALALTLPAEWGCDGVYEIMGDSFDSDGAVHVRHRFTKEIMKVDKKDLPETPDFASLTIAYNWSETRAALIRAGSSGAGGGNESCLIGGYFKSHLVVMVDGFSPFKTPDSKKRIPTSPASSLGQGSSVTSDLRAAAGQVAGSASASSGSQVEAAPPASFGMVKQAAPEVKDEEKNEPSPSIPDDQPELTEGLDDEDAEQPMAAKEEVFDESALAPPPPDVSG